MVVKEKKEKRKGIRKKENAPFGFLFTCLP
jgi:hypothetical protein